MGEVRWEHAYDASDTSALTRAELGAWGPDEPLDLRVGDLRTLIATSGFVAAWFAGMPIEMPGDVNDGRLVARFKLARGFGEAFWSEVGVAHRREPTAERLEAGQALLCTWYLLTRSTTAGPPGPAPAELVTAARVHDGGAVPAVVLIVGALAAAGVLAFGAQKAAEVIDRDLEREAVMAERDAQRADASSLLLSVHAEVQKVLSAHADAELAAGRTLPLSTATRAAVSGLRTSQRALLRVLTTQGDLPPRSPLPTPLPNLGKGGGGLFAGFGLGAAVAVAAALYLLGGHGR